MIQGVQTRAFPFLLSLLLSGIILSRPSLSQPSPETTPVPLAPPASAPTLVGKTPPRWIISKKNWTNTSEAVWLGGTKGHVTVIEFLRINCSHCLGAAPARRALYLKYHKLGVEMVGFQSPGDINNPQNTENDWSLVKHTIRDWQLPYPIAFDSKRALFDRYGLQFYPSILVLDREGVVRFQQSGFDEKKAKDLDAAIARMVEEGA